jgi:hypothetical protein
VILVPLLLSSWQSAPPEFDPKEFARRIQAAFHADYQIQKKFIYLERRRDVKISKLGNVTVGPLRTFEVYPSDEPGGTYKRLIEQDGKPLPPHELARRDAEHARDLREAEARLRSDNPREQAARRREAEAEQRERDALLADAVAVFHATYVGQDTIDGETVLIVELTPRSNARVSTREGRWMKHFAGRIWVDADQYHVVKLDMRAFEDISIGWGVIGRINSGCRVFYSRRRFEHAWLPAELTYEASGRTMLFRPFQVKAMTTFSDYKRR